MEEKKTIQQQDLEKVSGGLDTFFMEIFQSARYAGNVRFKKFQVMSMLIHTNVTFAERPAFIPRKKDLFLIPAWFVSAAVLSGSGQS